MTMLKVKTAELTGAALDWAVAKAVGLITGKSGGVYTMPTLPDGEGRRPVFIDSEEIYSPSTDWSQGGPLIDEFQIFLRPPHNVHVNLGRGKGEWRDYPDWSATVSGRVGTIPSKLPDVFPDGVARGSGTTALIASCRAIVLLRLGDEVEVPQELVTVEQEEPETPKVVDPALRKCHSETCWDCHGTGINDGGFICTTNNQIPF